MRLSVNGSFSARKSIENNFLVSKIWFSIQISALKTSWNSLELTNFLQIYNLGIINDEQLIGGWGYQIKSELIWAICGGQIKAHIRTQTKSEISFRRVRKSARQHVNNKLY